VADDAEGVGAEHVVAARRGVQAVEQERRVQIAHVRVRDLRRAIVALLARAVEVIDEAVSAILLRV
jgi:hypothetical protein